MRRIQIIAATLLLAACSAAHAQVGMPGVSYAGTIAAGTGGQLYPYDRQDPWLHGQYQRVPAYGGFNSFRPYNYRHVFSQTQVSSQWGSAHGMPYSQQFWNRYKGSYLEGNLHSQAVPQQYLTYPTGYAPQQAYPQQAYPQQYAPAPQPAPNYGPQAAVPLLQPQPVSQNQPVHIYPTGLTLPAGN